MLALIIGSQLILSFLYSSMFYARFVIVCVRDLTSTKIDVF